MAGFSDYLELEVLDHVFGNSAYASPTTVYMSLHTADPGETGTSEATGGSYVRQAITFGAAAAGQIQNSGEVQFDDLPAATITHGGVYDAASGGNFLAGGSLTESKVVSAGDSLKVIANNFTITLD